MQIFGHRRQFYLIQFAKFQYRVARGNGLKGFLYGKVKAIFGVIITLGTAEIVGQGWWNVSILQYIPWWVLVLIPVFETVTDYYVGLMDERKIKLFQIEQEILLRKDINPWETEKMKRLIAIERKVSPETADDRKRYKTYVKGEESSA